MGVFMLFTNNIFPDAINLYYLLLFTNLLCLWCVVEIALYIHRSTKTFMATTANTW